MSSSQYYIEMRELARRKREEYSLSTADITFSTVRQIYKREGIVIDACPGKLRKLKAAYFNDANGCSVLLNMKLPDEPRLFAMIHELKHHYVDRDKLRCVCEDIYESVQIIEIGAEVFAAEFIFPEKEFQEFAEQYCSPGRITPETIVVMKYNCPALVSYQFLQKSLHRLGYIEKDQFRNEKFQNLHKQIYGNHHFHKPKSERI